MTETTGIAMNQRLAENLLKYAEEKANSLAVNVCIAITDSGAHLNAFKRMDHAFTGSIDVAIGKARTSSLFPVSSGDFGQLVRNESLTGMELTNQGLVAFPGGVPVKCNNRLLGAIGISGATAEQDEAIANYAIATSLEDINGDS